MAAALDRETTTPQMRMGTPLEVETKRLMNTSTREELRAYLGSRNIKYHHRDRKNSFFSKEEMAQAAARYKMPRAAQRTAEDQRPAGRGDVGDEHGGRPSKKRKLHTAAGLPPLFEALMIVLEKGLEGGETGLEGGETGLEGVRQELV